MFIYLNTIILNYGWVFEKKYIWQLKSVIDQCLKARPGNTPVLIARQVGRRSQSKKLFTLDSIPIEEIDMLSIIIIGNSQTTLIDEIFLTPRGYLKNST